MPISQESRVLLFDIALPTAMILTLLGGAGVFSADALERLRRYFIVGAFALAALVTPPDVLSQLTLAAALVLLYEWSVYSVRLIENN